MFRRSGWVVVWCALSVFAAGLLVAPTQAQADPKAPVAQRAKAAQKAFESALAGLSVGTHTPESVYVWSVRWLDAELAVDKKKARQSYTAHQGRMSALEGFVKKGVASGTLSVADAAAAEFYRLEADIWARQGKRQ